MTDSELWYVIAIVSVLGGLGTALVVSAADAVWAGRRRFGRRP